MAVSDRNSGQEPGNSQIGEILAVEDPVEETALQNGWGARQYHTLYTAMGGQRCFALTMSVPDTDRAGMAYDVIRAFFASAVQTEKKTWMDYAGQNITPEMLGGTAEWCYAELDWTLRWETDRLICFSGYAEGYGGGVHGWSKEHFAVFDLADGRRLSLPDLFADPEAGVSALAAEVLAQIESEDGASANRRDDAEMLFSDADFLRENFFLTGEGIGIRFNTYDIDCYAAGWSEYMVSYDLLAAYLESELFGD